MTVLGRPSPSPTLAFGRTLWTTLQLRTVRYRHALLHHSLVCGFSLWLAGLIWTVWLAQWSMVASGCKYLELIDSGVTLRKSILRYIIDTVYFSGEGLAKRCGFNTFNRTNICRNLLLYHGTTPRQREHRMGSRLSPFLLLSCCHCWT